MPQLVAIAGGIGCAWLFWCVMEPHYRAAQKEGLKSGQRRELIILWTTIGMFFLGMLITGQITVWWRFGHWP